MSVRNPNSLTGYKYSGNPINNFKAPRDVGVNSKVVECPQCKADVGEWCTGLLTKGATHKSRRRMAVRLRNEALA